MSLFSRRQARGRLTASRWAADRAPRLAGAGALAVLAAFGFEDGAGTLSALTEAPLGPVNQALLFTTIAAAAAVGAMFVALRRSNARLAAMGRRSDDNAQALAESERRNSSLVESIPDILFRLDAEGRFLYVQADEAVLVAPKEHLIGRTFYDVLPPDVAARGVEGIGQVLKTGEMDRFEYRLTLPMREAYFEARIIRLTDDEVFAIVRDVTDRKTWEAALAATTDSLQRSNAELDSFASAASHDLRQPLRMVGSYVSLLEKRLEPALDQETHEFMRFIQEGVHHMDSMLVSLLDYSRVGRDGQPMEWTEPRDAFDRAAAHLKHDLQAADARLDIGGTWPSVWCCRAEMTRLFQNLLGNALKYRSPDLQPRITVDADMTDQSWQVSVRDNGVGIDPSQTGRLFQVFSRLHTDKGYEGTGIGLAICRKIVERHGGQIWVESEGAGHGSCFRFSLPLKAKD